MRDEALGAEAQAEGGRMGHRRSRMTVGSRVKRAVLLLVTVSGLAVGAQACMPPGVTIGVSGTIGGGPGTISALLSPLIPAAVTPPPPPAPTPVVTPAPVPSPNPAPPLVSVPAPNPGGPGNGPGGPGGGPGGGGAGGPGGGSGGPGGPGF